MADGHVLCFVKVGVIDDKLAVIESLCVARMEVELERGGFGIETGVCRGALRGYVESECIF